MDNPSSPLDTLRQLKEMLDAGALTPAEFEALKKRLLFQESAAAPAAAPDAAVPTPPAGPPAAPSAPQFFTPSSEAAPAVPAPEYVAPAVPRASETEAPIVPPLPPLVAFVSASDPTPEPVSAFVADEYPEAQSPAPKSPLALILTIGGVLALLAVVLYLSMNRPPSERISSTSLTPADTVAAPIETGPQAEQLPTVAAPETIRVAPTNPAPVVQPRPAPVMSDSVATPVAAPSDSALNR
ncbi:SHOCT domain-containing protein [Hymenobacter ruricola]|uniref:SHOCT domain-containing protein n=1 Tax=Hymenobacter ruricola TaxID=2791023 RepID=A0ABS0HY48_9BACT|nr:SHOCT domain-containing protein [Hymenobacter ruricola]MBF9219623.1 SHOCT domain-containing protein [Hymenobacter ruricola]